MRPSMPGWPLALAPTADTARAAASSTASAPAASSPPCRSDIASAGADAASLQEQAATLFDRRHALTVPHTRAPWAHLDTARVGRDGGGQTVVPGATTGHGVSVALSQSPACSRPFRHGAGLRAECTRSHTCTAPGVAREKVAARQLPARNEPKRSGAG